MALLTSARKAIYLASVTVSPEVQGRVPTEVQERILIPRVVKI